MVVKLATESIPKTLSKGKNGCRWGGRIVGATICYKAGMRVLTAYQQGVYAMVVSESKQKDRSMPFAVTVATLVMNGTLRRIMT